MGLRRKKFEALPLQKIKFLKREQHCYLLCEWSAVGELLAILDPGFGERWQILSGIA